MNTLTPPVATELREAGPARHAPEAYWRSLQLFNGYRLAAALLLLLAAAFWGDTLQFGSRNMRLFLLAAAGYAAFALAMPSRR